MSLERGEYTFDEDEPYVPYKPVKQRRLEAMQRLQSRSRAIPVREDEVVEPSPAPGPPPATSLVQEARELRAHAPDRTHAEVEAEEEKRILEAHAERKKLASHAELAHGMRYAEPLRRSWVPPAFVRARSEAENAALRAKHQVLVEGEALPPLIANFRDMKVPVCVIEHLARRGIERPTPIQMQGLPAAFSGRDMIGIAFTGSGKTLTFSLPLALFAAEAERRLPFEAKDGPIGIIVCPSRELARQTCESIQAIGKALEHGGYAAIRVLLCIGGINMSDQAHLLRRGVHIVVATPGRLQDMVERERFTLAACSYLCLDEADRMIDMGFEDDVRNILSYFSKQRQTLLFSATMPKKIRDFAEQSLVKPVIVNVGRAGAASLDVIQEVEFVEADAKMGYLLECLQKTAPPVMIFSDHKNEVDDIHEFLLRKGVEAVSIHGSKTQEEREYAIQSFKSRQKDVMVANGVASKGLDFSEVQHVINYTMPREIEDYVHQIGRTGRSGKTGVATTLVNYSTPEQTLLDLKYLLIEAKQRLPPFLFNLEDPRAVAGGPLTGCAMCGGLGHSVRHCPKLDEYQRRTTAHFARDDGGSGGY